MGFFASLADGGAFRTSPTGERLLYLGGRRTRPYIIPDAATEKRLHRKYRWINWGTHGSLYAGELLLVLLRPGLIHDPYWFVVYLVGVLALHRLAIHFAFAGDVARLRQTLEPLPARWFYGRIARRFGRKTLAAMIVYFAGMAVFFGWQVDELGYFFAILIGGAQGFLAIGCAYLLYLKRGEEEPPENDATAGMAPPLARRYRPPGHRRRLARMVLWNAYAILTTVIWAVMSPDDIRLLGVWGLIEATTMGVALVVVFLNAWDRPFLPAGLRKSYAFAYLVWDWPLNVLIVPHVLSEPLVPSDLWYGAFFVPLYFALFSYAYRKKWDRPQSAQPTRGVLATGT